MKLPWSKHERPDYESMTVEDLEKRKLIAEITQARHTVGVGGYLAFVGVITALLAAGSSVLGELRASRESHLLAEARTREAQIERIELESRTAEARKELESLRAESATTEQDLASLREEIFYEERRAEELTEANRRARQELSSLRLTVEGMVASVSGHPAVRLLQIGEELDRHRGVLAMYEDLQKYDSTYYDELIDSGPNPIAQAAAQISQRIDGLQAERGQLLWRHRWLGARTQPLSNSHSEFERPLKSLPSAEASVPEGSAE